MQQPQQVSSPLRRNPPTHFIFLAFSPLPSTQLPHRVCIYIGTYVPDPEYNLGLPLSLSLSLRLYMYIACQDRGLGFLIQRRCTSWASVAIFTTTYNSLCRLPCDENRQTHFIFSCLILSALHVYYIPDHLFRVFIDPDPRVSRFYFKQYHELVNFPSISVKLLIMILLPN